MTNELTLLLIIKPHIVRSAGVNGCSEHTSARSTDHQRIWQPKSPASGLRQSVISHLCDLFILGHLSAFLFVLYLIDQNEVSELAVKTPLPPHVDKIPQLPLWTHCHWTDSGQCFQNHVTVPPRLCYCCHCFYQIQFYKPLLFLLYLFLFWSLYWEHLIDCWSHASIPKLHWSSQNIWHFQLSIMGDVLSY